MVAFLGQEVVGRVARAQPRKGVSPRRRGGPAVRRPRHPFALLGRHCQSLERAGLHGSESPPNPGRKEKAWKEACTALKRGQHQSKRKQYVDRGRRTLRNGYTRDQYIACLEGSWLKAGTTSSNTCAPRATFYSITRRCSEATQPGPTSSNLTPLSTMRFGHICSSKELLRKKSQTSSPQPATRKSLGPQFNDSIRQGKPRHRSSSIHNMPQDTPADHHVRKSLHGALGLH
jgi:hypothetical protein